MSADSTRPITADGTLHRHATAIPEPWIMRHAHLVPAGSRVLDLACGEGRHARYFAARGADVLAVDRSATALASLAGVARVATRELDLQTGDWPLAGERFDAIVVVNYLHRPLFAAMLASLAPDGVLLYQTFARGNEAFGRPSNPDFLLQPDELFGLVVGRLTVVAFEQGVVQESGRAAVVQRIAAVGSGRGWPPVLSAGEPERRTSVE